MNISVITVCRNDLDGLKRTFESVRAQQNSAMEWWVVDGGSTDGTPEWLAAHHRLPGGWRSEPDEGIYDAMNKGIALARGEYLLFLNSGDSLAEPEVISRLLSRIEGEREAPDFVYGDSLDVEPNGRSHYRRARPISHLKVGMPARHQAMVYRRRAVGEGYPADLKLSGDYALTARVLMTEGARVLQVDFPLCLFCLGGRHETQRVRALAEDFAIRRTILKAGLPECVLLFGVHWLHHKARALMPALNNRLIYGNPKRP